MKATTVPSHPPLYSDKVCTGLAAIASLLAEQQVQRRVYLPCFTSLLLRFEFLQDKALNLTYTVL